MTGLGSIESLFLDSGSVFVDLLISDFPIRCIHLGPVDSLDDILGSLGQISEVNLNPSGPS